MKLQHNLTIPTVDHLAHLMGVRHLDWFYVHGFVKYEVAISLPFLYTPIY